MQEENPNPPSGEIKPNDAPSNKKHGLKLVLKIFIVICLISAAAVFYVSLRIVYFGQAYMFNDPVDMPKTQAVMILGASVYADGRLSDILKDRTDTAAGLYRDGKAEKILVSGYHRNKNYDEVNSIQTYLRNIGIPESDLLLDRSGFDTYDSLYRAKQVYNINSLAISTQNYHLPRAIYIARNLGIDAYGLSADRNTYQKIKFFTLRETFARFKAFIDILIKAKPERSN